MVPWPCLGCSRARPWGRHVALGPAQHCLCLPGHSHMITDTVA